MNKAHIIFVFTCLTAFLSHADDHDAASDTHAVKVSTYASGLKQPWGHDLPAGRAFVGHRKAG